LNGKTSSLNVLVPIHLKRCGFSWKRFGSVCCFGTMNGSVWFWFGFVWFWSCDVGFMCLLFCNEERLLEKISSSWLFLEFLHFLCFDSGIWKENGIRVFFLLCGCRFVSLGICVCVRRKTANDWRGINRDQLGLNWNLLDQNALGLDSCMDLGLKWTKIGLKLYKTLTK